MPGNHTDPFPAPERHRRSRGRSPKALVFWMILIFFVIVLILELTLKPGRLQTSVVSPTAAPALQTSETPAKPAASPTPPEVQAETPASTPPPPPKIQPTPDILPTGKYILLRRVVITDDKGVWAISPGTVVAQASRKGSRVRIIFGDHDTEVDATDLTRDRTIWTLMNSPATPVPTASAAETATPAEAPAKAARPGPSPAAARSLDDGSYTEVPGS